VYLKQLKVRNLRNIHEADLDLAPGLNVFVGSNAQGKTSLLEAVALLSRARSFRTDDTRSLIRRGLPFLRTAGSVADGGNDTLLAVEVASDRRRLYLDGREVPPRAYQGRLDVVVYATDRLRVVRGSMRERRMFIDRSASSLWPAYRQQVRDYERVVQQRNAALESSPASLDAWDERLVATGAELRTRRGAYVGRLREALQRGYRAAGETYDLRLRPEPPASPLEAARDALWNELRERRRDEIRQRRSLAGPHRDAIDLLIDGVDAGDSASAGQARSLLLALTLAVHEVHRQERGSAPVALLDDLDSELDDDRAAAICRETAAHGQALVTTAHPAWATRIARRERTFHVADGCFSAAP
jgi:DNA replication and repair protein RecF